VSERGWRRVLFPSRARQEEVFSSRAEQGRRGEKQLLRGGRAGDVYYTLGSRGGCLLHVQMFTTRFVIILEPRESRPLSAVVLIAKMMYLWSIYVVFIAW